MHKTFFVGWVVIFVVSALGSFVVHGVLLREDYLQISNLFRPEAEAQSYLPLLVLAYAIMAGALAWIYEHGVEAGPWLPQGLRFGVAVALLAVVPTYIVYYVVQPMPGMVVLKQIVLDSILMLILGVVLAFVFRQPVRSS